MRTTEPSSARGPDAASTWPTVGRTITNNRLSSAKNLHSEDRRTPGVKGTDGPPTADANRSGPQSVVCGLIEHRVRQGFYTAGRSDVDGNCGVVGESLAGLVDSFPTLDGRLDGQSVADADVVDEMV